MAANDELVAWVERVTEFLVEEWGMPPITGRIVGWLMVCDPAEQSAGEIADAIRASRASLTSNMRFLTSVGLVRRTRRLGDRTAYYRIEDDAWHKVIQRKLDSLGAFGEIADEGLKLVGDSERIHAAHKSMLWLKSLAELRPRTEI
ncbi:GbsR/MarR family transcriptional regulator [Kibdelosporangium aridum]|uniref:GbsR/MarR family transcriptional regulator n=1 Tax=Kibdelosporangium aridum TaxID=2030 RepID=UPI000525AEED